MGVHIVSVNYSSEQQFLIKPHRNGPDILHDIYLILLDENMFIKINELCKIRYILFQEFLLMYAFICLSVCLSVCLSACLSACLPVCLSIHPSIVFCLFFFNYVS